MSLAEFARPAMAACCCYWATCCEKSCAVVAEHAAEVLDELTVKGGDRGCQSVSMILQVRGGARLEVGDRGGREASPIPRWPLVKLPTMFPMDSDADVCGAAWRALPARGKRCGRASRGSARRVSAGI